MIWKVTAKAMSVGRFASAVFGLALVLGLVFGVGTMALAAVPGNPFRLGQVNLISTISVLGGNTNNAMLRLINNSEGSNATALNIQVKPNRPPMTVNSTREVEGLNVDSLDGRTAGDFLQESIDRDDFLPDDNYVNLVHANGQPNGMNFAAASCDPGDERLSGGYTTFGDVSGAGAFLQSEPDPGGADTWRVAWVDNFQIRVTVRCADFPPQHQD